MRVHSLAAPSTFFDAVTSDLAMFAAAKLHAMYRIGNATIRPFPFPHVCVEDVFPPEFYAEIRRHMVADQAYRRLVDTGRVGRGYSPARLSLFPEDLDAAPISDEDRTFWRRMFEVFNDREFAQLWLQLFKLAIRAHLAETQPDASQERRPMGSEVFLMRDLESYSLGPHTDSRTKVVSVLFYLPADGEAAGLGTSFYLPKDRGFVCPGGPNHGFEAFERVATMAYRPNALLAFPKTQRSFHGVEPVVGQNTRRDLMLYDLKLRDGRVI